MMYDVIVALSMILRVKELVGVIVGLPVQQYMDMDMMRKKAMFRSPFDNTLKSKSINETKL